MASMTLRTVDSRGQLLLVGGVVIAALLITIGIVFNAALFTEARLVSDTSGGNAAASEEVKNSIRIDIVQIISTENEQMDSTAPSDTQQVIANIDTYLQNRQAQYGVVTTVDEASTTEGTRAEWTDETASFTNPDGNATWEVASFNQIRAYSVTPDTDSLAELSDPSASTLNSSAFGIRFNPADPDNETRYIYVNSNTDDLTVRAVDASETITATCTISNSTGSSIHLTGNMLTTDEATTRCEELWPDISVTEVEYINGQQAKGRFNFTVEGSSITTHSNIQTADAVYAIEVAYHYQTSDVKHTTTTRVAPKEP